MVAQPRQKINTGFWRPPGAPFAPCSGWLVHAIIKPACLERGVIPIRRDTKDSRHERVYLLPKTIDYYQEQLTRLLEEERFAEAADLLAFLLACRTDDAITVAEWQRLYDWLADFAGEGHPAAGGRGIEEGTEGEDAASEQDLRMRRLAAKASDPAYVERLLDMLRHETDLEKKLLAVDQLALADHPGVDAAHAARLEGARLHPLLQFRVLQTLKRRGVPGTVVLERGGGTVELAIADTPLSMDEFPAAVRSVPDMVRRALSLTDPGMAPFAAGVWQDFLACVYGTNLYGALAAMTGREAAVWAAGLHEFLVLSVTGEDPEKPVLPFYKLKETDAKAVRASRNALLTCMRNPYGPF